MLAKLPDAADQDTTPLKVQLEQSILGLMLRHDGAAALAQAELAAWSDKFEPPHNRIFAAAFTLSREGKAVSPSAVARFLGDDPGLHVLHGGDYLISLTQAAPAIGTAAELSPIIRRLAQDWRYAMADCRRKEADELLRLGGAEHFEGASAALHEAETLELPAGGIGLHFEWFDHVQPEIDGAELVEGLLDHGAMSVTYGESNAGKTFVALDIGYSVASGTPWMGRAVDAALVIYVAAEGGTNIRKRISALRSAKQVPGPVRMALVSCSINLLEPAGDGVLLVDLIRRAAEESGARPGLIVIDTLGRAMAGGNENAPEDMGAFVGNLDHIRAATGAHLMVVHHSGKNKAAGARGHSSLRAATDTEMEVTPGTVEITKQRDREGGQVIGFTLERVEVGTTADGKPVTSCVVRAIEGDIPKSAPTGRLSDQQKLAMGALTAVINSKGEPAPAIFGLPGNVTVAATAIWRQELFDRGVLDPQAKNPREPFRRLKASLQARNLIAEREGRVWTVRL